MALAANKLMASKISLSSNENTGGAVNSKSGSTDSQEVHEKPGTAFPSLSPPHEEALDLSNAKRCAVAVNHPRAPEQNKPISFVVPRAAAYPPPTSKATTSNSTPTILLCTPENDEPSNHVQLCTIKGPNGATIQLPLQDFLTKWRHLTNHYPSILDTPDGEASLWAKLSAELEASRRQQTLLTAFSAAYAISATTTQCSLLTSPEEEEEKRSRQQTLLPTKPTASFSAATAIPTTATDCSVLLSPEELDEERRDDDRPPPRLSPQVPVSNKESSSIVDHQTLISSKRTTKFATISITSVQAKDDGEVISQGKVPAKNTVQPVATINGSTSSLKNTVCHMNGNTLTTSTPRLMLRSPAAGPPVKQHAHGRVLPMPDKILASVEQHSERCTPFAQASTNGGVNPSNSFAGCVFPENVFVRPVNLPSFANVRHHSAQNSPQFIRNFPVSAPAFPVNASSIPSSVAPKSNNMNDMFSWRNLPPPPYIPNAYNLRAFYPPLPFLPPYLPAAPPPPSSQMPFSRAVIHRNLHESSGDNFSKPRSSGIQLLNTRTYENIDVDDDDDIDDEDDEMDIELNGDANRSKNGSESDPNNAEKIKSKRERNRQAAARCREKKMNHIKSLQEKVKRINDVNRRLKLEREQLRAEVSNLQRLMETHLSVGCRITPLLPTTV